MSSINVLSSLPNDHFLCSICANIFNDPVTTPCGHSFCKTCLNQHWDQSEFCQCPTCHKRFLARPEICTNAVIQEISVQLKRRKVDMLEMAVGLLQVQCDVCIETAFRAVKSCLVCQTSYCSVHLEPHLRVPGLMRHKLIEPVDNIEERVCPIHDKVLDFYCRNDEVCVCSVCIETDHQDHNVVSLDEESVRQKEKIDSQTVRVKMMIDERMDKIKKFTDSSSIRTEKVHKEIQNMDAVINIFTRHIQEAQAKVKTSIEEKLKTYQARDEVIMKELHKDISNLKLRHSELEELLQTDDPLHLLQTLQTIRSHSETKDWTKSMVYSGVCLETVRLAVSQLLETFQALLKSLTKEEIARMKQYKESLTFDPSTAGHYLVVYDCDKCIKHHNHPTQSVTGNPERFALPMVFGTTGFTSGRHYWEVYVGLRCDWDVGVAKETVSRKDDIIVKSDNGFYAIGKDRLTYKAHCTRSTVLQLAPRPTHIGVYLDYEDGRVSFYDVNENKHIHSFTGQTFTEKLYPYFYLYSKAKKSEPIELCSMSEYIAFLTNIYNQKKEKEKQNSVFST